MLTIRPATREEVVAYYITSELQGFLENADIDPTIHPKAFKAFHEPGAPHEPGKPFEGALQHMSRALLDIWRDHAWLYEQFWSRSLQWSLVELQPCEIDVTPLGGEVDEFHYPKLDKFVQELKSAAASGQRIKGVYDDPKVLLASRGEPVLKRLIVINGEYRNRRFDYAIGDGAHRAIILAAAGAVTLQAYSGVPDPSLGEAGARDASKPSASPHSEGEWHRVKDWLKTVVGAGH